MSITYEEALATLQNMFGEPWDEDSLDTVLRYQKGHMENTVDLILRHGSQDPSILVDQIESGINPYQQQSSTVATSVDAELARQLSQSQTTTAATNTATTNTNISSGIGKVTTLPDDFLRIPGYIPSVGPNSFSDDEALARMLQDELFTEELRRNPDFAHLARGSRISDSRLPNRTSATNTTNNTGINPAAAAVNRFQEFTRSFTNTGSQQQQRNDNAPPPSPNIIDKISELGDNAKRRLQLLAAQFNANNNLKNNSGTGSTTTTTRAPEFRSLLDHDDDNMELAARKDL